MDHLTTETRNPASAHLDRITPLELVQLMNAEDAQVAPAVASQAHAIAQAIEVIAERLGRGGRLVYIGAGTSGRLGVLDATECPPTFNSPPGQVVGVIAGGPAALTQAIEGAEDKPELAERDLGAIQLAAGDVLVGIATSGRTPYVCGALQYARKLGAFTIGLSCNPDSDLVPLADLAITPVVGPEVLTGSTRLKAGTATKLVLNVLTTGAMVRLGKAFGNLMVDLRATNTKLRARTNRIIRQLTGLSHADAHALLTRCGGELKTALVAQLGGIAPDAARQRLQAAGGRVGLALEPTPISAEPAADVYLGIDGGGTHTIALLARPDTEGRFAIIGRGNAGPSNVRAVGPDAALRALDEAVGQAFVAAGIKRATLTAACLGLAGAGRDTERRIVEEWCRRQRLAQHVQVVTDVELLLAAGTPEGWGIALVAGTGSCAWGRSADGRTARAGGWGQILGDEGSAYSIVVSALRAAVHADDGRGPATALGARLLQAMQLTRPTELIGAVQSPRWDRAPLAALAPVVFDAAARGDDVARSILGQHARALADAVAAVARQLTLTTFALALAGGILCHHPEFQERVLADVRARQLLPAPITLVAEPALGALRLAGRLSRG